ncbi:MAG: TasA family protein, partial [Clostridia bacterium]|nr:TasA family protein [Clostridia bacterium]
MNKKKVLVLAVSVCLVAILAIGGTLAYFTDTDAKTNTFTVGNVDITLTEPNW